MAAGIPPGTAKAGTGDITGVTAGVGISGGGDSGALDIALDLHELTAANVADGDFIPIIDTNDSNGSRKEAVADLATLFAGDGLTASSSALAVGVDDTTIETNSDALRIKDNGVSLDKMASLTRGSMIIGNASGDPAELTKGNTNYVLTSDGTDIAWAAASAGAVTALNNATANEIVTVGSTTTELDAESTLTFASSKLIPTATAHDAAGTALTMSAGATTAGTSNNQAGGALTLQGGQGKGSGAGGDIIFQTANAAGSGDALNSLATALTLSDDLSATFAGAVDLGSNTLTTTGSLQVRTIDYSDGDLSMTIADGGGVTFAQAVTADAGVAIDNITIDGTEIDLSSGDLTLDVAGDIILDAGGGQVFGASDLGTDLGSAAIQWNTLYARNMHLDFSPDAPADHAASGITATFRAGAGAAVAQFDLVSMSTTEDEVIVADADAYATSKVLGIALAAISDNAEGEVLLFGVIRDNSWTWTSGNTLYLHTGGTGSTISATAPSATGDFVVPIGYALSPDTIFFKPDMTLIEHA